MSGDIQIKQFELSEREALLAFLRIAYPDDPRKSEPVYWDWHYLENPYTDLDNIPLWIVKSGQEVLGQAATIPVEIKVGSEQTLAIWILDFIIHADIRGKGIGKRLLLKARETHPTMIALGFNEQSGRVLRSLDWVSLGGVHRYQRLLFPGEALGEISNRNALRKIMNLSYAPFRPKLAQFSPARGGEVRIVKEFDASFDRLWQEASVQWPCAVRRTSRYLEWQFMRQPDKQFDVLGFYQKDSLTGYAVLFFRKAEHGGNSSKVAISDLCYGPVNSRETIDGLLKAALRLALERRAGSLVTDVLDRLVEERLRRFGFWRIKRSPQFMAGALTRQDLLYDASNWFLTRADSDVSIFEHPNL
jgi:GNAT superfamily N-acetyltransferase